MGAGPAAQPEGARHLGGGGARPGQKTNVLDAITALSAALPALRKASSPFAPGLAALRLALKKAGAAEAALKVAQDQLDQLEAKGVLKEGQAAMAKALSALQGVKGVNPQIKKNLKILHDNRPTPKGSTTPSRGSVRPSRTCRPSTPTGASSRRPSSGSCSCSAASSP